MLLFSRTKYGLEIREEKVLLLLLQKLVPSLTLNINRARELNKINRE